MISDDSTNNLDKIISMVDNIDIKKLEEENIISDKLPSLSSLRFDMNMYIKCLIHELRIPITTLSLGLNIIESLIIKNNFNSRDFLCIIKDLYRTIEYTDNILTKFCVIQNGDITLNNFEIFNIHSLIRNVEIILQYNIKESNIIFECNIHKDVYEWFYGDKHNIKHCIINLIKNAIKYNSLAVSNKIILDVNIYNKLTTNDEQSLIISIIDNNNSIPQNIKDKLFEPFNSTSGSGLGLYICKKILELHNGSISHEYLDNSGNGNKFNIILHLKKCNNLELVINNNILSNISNNKMILEINDDTFSVNETILSEQSNDDKVNSDIDDSIDLDRVNSVNKKLVIKKARIYNIIIIDDSSINIKLMYKIFKNYPIFNKIICAVDGLEAINKIYNNIDQIDIVLIDNDMPNLNGIQTVKLLRGINFNKLIFGLTGSYNNHLSEFEKCGIDYLFSKPFDKNKIDILISFLNKNDINRPNKKVLKIINSELKWVD